MNYYHDRPLERVEALQYAETFAGKMEELERRAMEIGAPAALALVDQADAHMRTMRNAALDRLLGG